MLSRPVYRTNFCLSSHPFGGFSFSLSISFIRTLVTNFAGFAPILPLHEVFRRVFVTMRAVRPLYQMFSSMRLRCPADEMIRVNTGFHSTDVVYLLSLGQGSSSQQQ